MRSGIGVIFVSKGYFLPETSTAICRDYLPSPQVHQLDAAVLLHQTEMAANLMKCFCLSGTVGTAQLFLLTLPELSSKKYKVGSNFTIVQGIEPGIQTLEAPTLPPCFVVCLPNLCSFNLKQSQSSRSSSRNQI